MKPRFELTLLGTFQLTVDGEPVSGLTSEKIQALVAYVAVEQERVHSREFLAELLWPDRPAGVARQNLRQALLRLQRALPTTTAPLLQISRQTIHLHETPTIQVDLMAFLESLAEVHRHQHKNNVVSNCPHCCQLLATAVKHYQGDFLDGLFCDSPAFDEWALLKREWLRREMLQALNTLVQHHEAAQRWTDAYHFAWRSVEIDPLREVAHQQVMQALAQSGQRKAALDQYATLCRLLHDELGAKPATTTTALFETIRDHSFAAGDVPSVGTQTAGVGTQTAGVKPTIPYNPPVQHTSFVGRRQELRQITERLSHPECHLLTLVGPGGVGKSRLALEAANRQLQTHADAYPDGIHFIPLATVEDDEQLLNVLAAVWDFPFPDDLFVKAERQAALVQHVQTKQALLLLDNYEQLTDFTDLIVALLTAAPHLQLLVTSRVPLHLHAEWLLDIGGLSYPTAADLTAAPWAASPMPWTSEPRSPVAFEAVQLFISAAQRVLPDFTLTDQVSPAVARLCFLTEGLPLALELAAAQVRNVPLVTLVEAVQQNLDALATTMRDVPLRHRSLRAVFNHSWTLLTPALQQVFRRLAVFRGSFTAEAAQRVTGCTPALFGALVTNAFVREVPEHSVSPHYLLPERGARYLLHEVLRRYAIEQLQQEEADERQTRCAHSRYYLAQVAELQPLLGGDDTRQGIALLQEALDNVRAGWQWAAATCAVDSLQPCISPLLRFFVLTGQTEEGRYFADSALRGVTAWLAATPDKRSPTQLRAQRLQADLHAMRARLFYRQARYAAGIDDAAMSFRMAADSGAQQTAALAALYWGICLLNLGNYAETEAKLTVALTHAQAGAFRKIESDALRALGILADQQQEWATARRYYEASLAISRENDDLRGTSASLGNVGNICRQQGDFAAARQFLAQSLALHRQIGDRSSEGRTLTLLGELSTDLEEYPQAERYLGEALEILRGLGEEHYAADALVALGKVYREQGRHEWAVACWQEAEEIYVATNEAPFLAEVRAYLRTLTNDL